MRYFMSFDIIVILLILVYLGVMRSGENDFFYTGQAERI